MDDKNKTAAAIVMLIGFIVLLVFIGIVLLKGKKVVSPVPDESVIKIIFISPTPPSSGAGPNATASGIPLATPESTPVKQ